MHGHSYIIMACVQCDEASACIYTHCQVTTLQKVMRRMTASVWPMKKDTKFVVLRTVILVSTIFIVSIVQSLKILSSHSLYNKSKVNNLPVRA